MREDYEQELDLDLADEEREALLDELGKALRDEDIFSPIEGFEDEIAKLNELQGAVDLAIENLKGQAEETSNEISNKWTEEDTTLITEKLKKSKGCTSKGKCGADFYECICGRGYQGANRLRESNLQRAMKYSGASREEIVEALELRYKGE